MQAQNHSIKSWAKDDRPREKLLSKSTIALSDAELISLVLANGNSEKSALEIARELLALAHNNLYELGTLLVDDMMKIRGIGKAKAASVMAALELGKRRQLAHPRHLKTIKSSQDVGEFLCENFKYYRHEIFAVLYLNRSNRIKNIEIITHGGLSSTIAEPRMIIRKALEQDATSIVLCHNHPSGALEPSEMDKRITVKIQTAAELFEIRVVDHIIVGQDGFFSFADNALL